MTRLTARRKPTSPASSADVVRTVRTIVTAVNSIPAQNLERAIAEAEAHLSRTSSMSGADRARAELELLRCTRGYRVDLEELAALALDTPLTPAERRHL